MPILTEVEPRAGGRWALSRVVTNPRGAWTTAAMLQFLAPGVENYFPPLRAAGPVSPVALVRLLGPIGTPDVDTVLLPDLALDQTVAALNPGQRNAMRRVVKDRFAGYVYTDYEGIAKTLPPILEADPDLADSATFRQVLRRLLRYLEHSALRSRVSVAETHNTNLSDAFDTDPTTRWTTVLGGAFTWDSGNGEIDGAVDALYQFNTTPGSLDHESQATAFNGAALHYPRFPGTRIDSAAQDGYVCELGETGDQNIYLSRYNAGILNNLITFARAGLVDNEFWTLRLASEGAAGANVVLSVWNQDHGTTKPADPGWIGVDGSPDGTFTDTQVDRLDASTHDQVGTGGEFSSVDERQDYWRGRAISDRGGVTITLDMWLGSRPDLEPPRRRLIPIDGFKIPPQALTQGESVLIDKWNRLTPDTSPPLRKLQPAEYGYFTIPEWALTQGETVLLDKWLGYYPSVLFRAQKSYEGFFDFPWEAIIPAVVITPDMWLGHRPDILFRAQKSHEGFFDFPWGVLVGAPEDVTLDKWLGTYPAFIVPRRFRAAWTGHFAFVSRINQTDLWGPAAAGDGFVAIICGDF